VAEGREEGTKRKVKDDKSRGECRHQVASPRTSRRFRSSSQREIDELIDAEKLTE